MKLSKTDRENVEVLESLALDEPTLFLLLCRYFAYRNRRRNGKFGLSPNQALEAVIRQRMQEGERGEIPCQN